VIAPRYLLLVGLVVAGCSGGSKVVTAPTPPKPGPTLDKIVGDWVVVATTANEGHTGKLTFKSDGTFDSTYSMPASTDGKHAASEESIAGNFVLGEEKVGEEKLIRVGLLVRNYNGAPTGSAGDIILTYQAKGNYLKDSMEVVYARPGEEAKVKEAVTPKK
jgi:hypothetical protein